MTRGDGNSTTGTTLSVEDLRMLFVIPVRIPEVYTIGLLSACLFAGLTASALQVPRSSLLDVSSATLSAVITTFFIWRFWYYYYGRGRGLHAGQMKTYTPATTWRLLSLDILVLHAGAFAIFFVPMQFVSRVPFLNAWLACAAVAYSGNATRCFATVANLRKDRFLPVVEFAAATEENRKQIRVLYTRWIRTVSTYAFLFWISLVVLQLGGEPLPLLLYLVLHYTVKTWKGIDLIVDAPRLVKGLSEREPP